MNARMLTGLLLTLQLTIPPVFAEDWVRLMTGTEKDGSKLYHYYDRDSVVKNGNWAEYRNKAEFSTDQHLADDIWYARIIAFNRVNCGDKSKGIEYLGGKFYDRSGKLVYYVDFEETNDVQQDSIDPNSSADIQYQHVCR
jgi:hypothetical protein